MEPWTGGSRSNAEDRQGRDKKRAGALHVDRSGRGRQNGGFRSSGVIATERGKFRSRHSCSSDGIIYQWWSDPPVMLASTKIRETGCERRCLHVAVIHPHALPVRAAIVVQGSRGGLKGACLGRCGA